MWISRVIQILCYVSRQPHLDTPCFVRLSHNLRFITNYYQIHNKKSKSRDTEMPTRYLTSCTKTFIAFTFFNINHELSYSDHPVHNQIRKDIVKFLVKMNTTSLYGCRHFKIPRCCLQGAV